LRKFCLEPKISLREESIQKDKGKKKAKTHLKKVLRTPGVLPRALGVLLCAPSVKKTSKKHHFDAPRMWRGCAYVK